jgi:hypothetical protein
MVQHGESSMRNAAETAEAAFRYRSQQGRQAELQQLAGSLARRQLRLSDQGHFLHGYPKHQHWQKCIAKDGSYQDPVPMACR